VSVNGADPSPELAGRRALVTGASRGIGAAVARRLAAAGADVILAARGAKEIEALAADLRRVTGTRALAVPVDLCDRDALAALMDTVRQEFGGLEILVNNAGVLPTAVPAVKSDWAQWDDTLAVNLAAPWYLSCRSRELMTGGGVILNIASTAALYPSRGLAPYNISKAGLMMLTRVLALEWARDGVRVVALAPGKIETAMIEPILRHVEKRSLAVNPMNRLGRDDEVAELVAFLVSERAAYITGVTVPIDGGELLSTSAG
jgi:3-oxoacyl-[acyl-carrier protein] reductase